MSIALIIEDNDNNMELISFILEKNSYRTIKATTGMEGIKLWQQFKPDFIILDIQLPDINGDKVLKKIREHSSGKNIPIIAMTSFAMAGDREKLLSAGCTGYIEKPIDPLHVMHQVRNILGNTV